MNRTRRRFPTKSFGFEDGERLRQTSIHLPVDLYQRLRKYAFDQEIALSAVMVDAIQAWLDAREG